MEATEGEDILAEKIKAYREMLKNAKPELDFELLQRILDMVNGSSEIKIAIDPIDEGGSWSSDAPTYAVAGVKTLEDGRLVLRANTEKHGIEAERLHSQIKKALKHHSGAKMPVLFMHKDDLITLTDVFSHALVREMYAGMPFDVVLAVCKEKKPKEEA